MPLQDHFRPPLSLRRHWHSFHNGWATSIAADLNTRLPEGYFAEPDVQFGIEIDVATFEEDGARPDPLIPAWAPPAPALIIPFPVVTDSVEVLIYEATGGPVLAGAIELISPANKDRVAHREAFVSKCETYLQAGLGLVVVDVVTSRGGSLHDALLARFHAADLPSTDLHASAYRPAIQHGLTTLEIWREPLAFGAALPALPLWLRSGPCLPVDLEASYERTRRELRMADGA